MKGATVYHKIKALRTHYSIRDCAGILGISVNTVQKYEAMSLEEASVYLGRQKRKSQFDEAREYILDQLEEFPRITASKLLRKVKEKCSSITAKERAFRKYLSPLRKQIRDEQRIRYYEPVIDMVPGHQVQVDMGEEAVCKDKDGNTFKIYFISFVFSYSRSGFVSFQSRPFNTESFIEAHLEAFDYFGGVAREYVYDQTKLVVITEKYREVFFNEHFHQFALRYEFIPKVCEGYDPESKGKVERFIRYVKEDFLYGDYFSGIEAVRQRGLSWLSEVANCRIHATTKRQPVEMFKEEFSFLSQRYLALKMPAVRWVDKTGLISFEGNKYSTPHAYQRQNIGVMIEEGTLVVNDLDSGEVVTTHEIPVGKGHIVKNNNHYRDYRKSVEMITTDTLKLFEEIEEAAYLIAQIKADNPRIMRDQLKGLSLLYKKFSPRIWREAMPTFMKLPHLRVSLIESVLVAYQQRQAIGKIETEEDGIEPDQSSCLDRSLNHYMEVLNHA